ncbi:hypothetical protein AVEN_77173-1, partial [Araneus ventricosus]
CLTDVWNLFDQENLIKRRPVTSSPRATIPSHELYLLLSKQSWRNITVPHLVSDYLVEDTPSPVAEKSIAAVRRCLYNGALFSRMLVVCFSPTQQQRCARLWGDQRTVEAINISPMNAALL